MSIYSCETHKTKVETNGETNKLICWQAKITPREGSVSQSSWVGICVQDP